MALGTRRRFFSWLPRQQLESWVAYPFPVPVHGCVRACLPSATQELNLVRFFLFQRIHIMQEKLMTLPGACGLFSFPFSTSFSCNPRPSTINHYGKRAQALSEEKVHVSKNKQGNTDICRSLQYPVLDSLLIVILAPQPN